MLRAFVWNEGQLQTLSGNDLASAVWFDMQSPTEEEYELVGRLTGFTLPLYETLAEIENSSNLSLDADILTLSLPTVYNDVDMLSRSVCGFVLSRQRLVTIRFSDNLTFSHFLPRPPAANVELAQHLFVSLLEGIVSRQADRLEKMREELEGLSRRVFQRKSDKKHSPQNTEQSLQHVLVILGQAYEAISYIRDCQLGIGRISAYVLSAVDWIPKTLRERLHLANKDVASLNEFSTHLTDKIQFLLDSTLGFINVSQNSLIKVLTIVSIVGIPPTLIAGIYGMNFKDIPELSWSYGYGYAWAVMVASAVLPLAWFRKKGWI